MASQENRDYGYKRDWMECCLQFSGLEVHFWDLQQNHNPGTATIERRILKTHLDSLFYKIDEFRSMLNEIHFDHNTRDWDKLKLLLASIKAERDMLDSYASPVFIRRPG